MGEAIMEQLDREEKAFSKLEQEIEELLAEMQGKPKRLWRTR